MLFSVFQYIFHIFESLDVCKIGIYSLQMPAKCQMWSLYQ